MVKGVGKITISPGCKGYSVTAVLQANSLIVSNITKGGGSIISRIPLQYDCCEELGVRFNLSHVSLHVTHKRIISHFDDLRYASKKISDLEKDVEEQECRNHHLFSHTSHSILVYIIIAVVLYFLYKLYVCIGTRARRVPRLWAKCPAEVTCLGNTVN